MTDLIIDSSPTAPEAAPLVQDLIREYDSRYGTRFNPEGAKAELYRYPPEAFQPPSGGFILLKRGAATIAGGAFMRHADPGTAEFKRIWTDGSYRRQGLAKQVVWALEHRAAAQGYTRVYLTTGFRQPEAVALYIGLGYRPLFDPDIDPELYLTLPFEKHIGRLAGQPGTTPLRVPGELPPELRPSPAHQISHHIHLEGHVR